MVYSIDLKSVINNLNIFDEHFQTVKIWLIYQFLLKSTNDICKNSNF